MIKHLTVVVTLFWLPIATALPALAQTPPAPPPAVVTEAQRFALVAGRTLTGEPQEWDTRTDERTGHIVWAMRWRPDTTSPLTVEVKVNEQTGKAVDYDDMLVSAAATAAYQSGQTVTVTQEQAVAKLDALLAGLPVTPGDWRLQTAELESHIQNDGSPGQPYWFVSKRRYFDGVPVFPGSSGAHINPYSGAIDGWYIEDNAVLVPPTGPQITQQQAQRIAYNTVTQLTGLSGTLVQNGPMWETLSNSTTLARLQYGFGYETPEVTIPAPDPEYPDESWTGKIFVGVSVDAETGEVLSAGNGGVDGRCSNTPVEAFSRLALLNELTKDHQNDPLALALASGKSAKAREPSKAAQRFTRQVNGKLVPFALNVEKRRLTWEVKPGEWSGVALAGTRGRELASWLEKAVSQAR